MKITYSEPLSAAHTRVVAGKAIQTRATGFRAAEFHGEIKPGATVDLPDAVAEKFLRDYPKNFKKAAANAECAPLNLRASAVRSK